MSTSPPRPVRPLDPNAVRAADDALYAAHAGDPRPNALYDAAGNRTPLSATDPAQQSLRDEWFQYYAAGGGTCEPADPGTTGPGQITQPCPLAKLTVHVNYDPLTAPVPNAKVTITGPVTKELTTDATGTVKFVDLPAGSYSVSATYAGTNSLVDAAAAKVGSADWAYATPRSVPPLDTFPAGTNKCNLFVYEMVTGAGYSVPPKSRWSYSRFQYVLLPPNAGDWASTTPNSYSTIVANPEPGDVIAWSHNYSDATGHVGIVSYPQPSPTVSKTLAAGDDASADLIMRRQTISAGSDTVEEDDHHFWHYWDEGNTAETGNIVFRRL